MGFVVFGRFLLKLVFISGSDYLKGTVRFLEGNCSVLLRLTLKIVLRYAS